MMPVVGIIFGIVGITGKIQRQSNYEKESQAAFKKCPKCAEIIKVEARLCKHYRNEFTDKEIQAEQIKQKLVIPNKEKVDISTISDKSLQEIYELGHCPKCGAGRTGKGGRCLECHADLFEYAKRTFEQTG